MLHSPNHEGDNGMSNHDRDKARRDAGAAWSTASGEPVQKTRPGHAPDGGGNTGGGHRGAGPETDHRGTDQESIVPGRSKPASEPAEDAPHDSDPGVPQ
jgi:hypothetical protein